MTIPEDIPRDYYAILQVQPGADPEVVEAAYRQLMKKHHPDLAGDDPLRIAEHLARAKVLNEAYSVLRNPARRRRYDATRRVYGSHRRPPPSRPRPAPGSVHDSHQTSRADPPPGDDRSEPDPSYAAILQPVPSRLPAPLALISAAYFLLPGPYEWDEGGRKEIFIVTLLPVAGVASFSLVTGRLAPWIGHLPAATFLAWGLVVLLFVPMLTTLPRIALAGGPSLVLLSGSASGFLQHAHVPVWFVWGMASLVSMVLAARLFVFGVLPAVAACWLLAHLT